MFNSKTYIVFNKSYYNYYPEKYWLFKHLHRSTVQFHLRQGQVQDYSQVNNYNTTNNHNHRYRWSLLKASGLASASEVRAVVVGKARQHSGNFRQYFPNLSLENITLNKQKHGNEIALL